MKKKGRKPPAVMERNKKKTTVQIKFFLQLKFSANQQQREGRSSLPPENILMYEKIPENSRKFQKIPWTRKFQKIPEHSMDEKLLHFRSFLVHSDQTENVFTTHFLQS